MATVYLARDRELERPVAVKVLADNLARDEDVRRRFLREGRLAARLGHANVVKVYDAGEEAGRPYIVMECVEGETVADLRRRHGGRLAPEEAVAVAAQAAAGLAHAHEAGLVHRDVKPQNLLVRPDGTVKIADFGIARAAEGTQLTQVGTVLGTAAYLAPEQAAGEEVTGAADVYALGAVLYELLTGRTPLEYSSLTELVAKQGAAVTPVRELAPDVPAALEEVVMRCLARNPAYRPASAGELARELRALSPEAPTEPLAHADRTRPYPVAAAPAHRQPWGRPHWGWIAAAGAAAVAALVLGLVLAHPGGGGGGTPTRSVPAATSIGPVQAGATPAAEARNLAAWLRGHSR